MAGAQPSKQSSYQIIPSGFFRQRMALRRMPLHPRNVQGPEARGCQAGEQLRPPAKVFRWQFFKRGFQVGLGFGPFPTFDPGGAALTPQFGQHRSLPKPLGDAHRPA